MKLQQYTCRFLAAAVMTLAMAGTLTAQQLEPRAYSISPTGVNVANLSYGYSTGDMNFDPSLPIDDASAKIHNAIGGYFRSINVSGRSANVSIVVPYAVGHLQGSYLGSFVKIYRSGLADSAARFSINLYGARAMTLKEFAAYHQRTNIGASVVVSAPTGQYDPTVLVSIGTNRWAFKPEIGLSHTLAKTRLILDGYTSAWIYTANNNYRGQTRSQKPLFNAQFHVSYDIKPKLWLAFDANFYRGGQTSIGGVERKDEQSNSRVGVTASFPVTRRQSIKASYSDGAITRIGGNFSAISFGYQYLWGAGL